MRAARYRQAMESGARAARIYPRYPRYPQAVCTFNGNNFMTAISPWPRRSSGNGGEPSQPQPQPSGLASHQAESSGAKGGAADEAAARRTMAGLPFSGCERGRLREAPKWFPGGLRARGKPQRGTGPSGPMNPPAESGISVSALPPVEPWASARGSSGQDRASARGLRNRRTQGFGSWTARQNRGFGRGSCRMRNRGFRRGTARAGSGTQVPNLPSGEPSGLRPCRGARGET
jgi:hypothetical protein